MIDLQEASVDGVTVVRMSGRLDGDTSTTADTWLRALLSRGTSSFVLDLTGVAFVSSSGLRVVLGAVKICSGQGGEVRVAGMSTQVRRVFEIAGFLRFMKTDETAEAGVAAIKTKA